MDPASWFIVGFAVIGGIIGTTLGFYKELGYFEGKVVAVLCGGAGALLGLLIASLFGVVR